MNSSVLPRLEISTQTEDPCIAATGMIQGHYKRQRDSSAVNVKIASVLTKPWKQRKCCGQSTGLDEENTLIKLCRTRNWPAVIQRCRTNPEEATPVRVSESSAVSNQFTPVNSRRTSKNNPTSFNVVEPVYFQTALGIVCASSSIISDDLCEVLIALTRSCPQQVRASQLIPGHTPMRDLILNPKCCSCHLKVLVDADFMCSEKSESGTVFSKKDIDGVVPIEHIIIRIQLGSSLDSIRMLKELFNKRTRMRHSTVFGSSPLIRLLTLGSSVRPRITAMETQENNIALEGMLEAVQHLIEVDPSLLQNYSELTGCSVVHLVLRNFGNCKPLVFAIAASRGSEVLMSHKNHSGDLPLHVACTACVPFQVLQFIIKRTIASASSRPSLSLMSTNPLIWSVNNLGYTAIDLEWIRYIKGGQGLLSAESFHLQGASIMRKSCIGQDQYYDLLKDAVEHAMAGRKTLGDKYSSLDKRAIASNTFGSLLDRIALLITAAASSRHTISSNSLLHEICKLSTMDAPRFPSPLLDLFVWIHRPQLLERDQYGLLPIHYLLSNHQGERPPFQPTHFDTKKWTESVARLLRLGPESGKVTTPLGRLPLHLALDHGQRKYQNTSVDREARHEVVRNLVGLFPEAVDQRDPVTKLDPFLMAASDDAYSLDSVYFLLRHSPSNCVVRE